MRSLVRLSTVAKESQQNTSRGRVLAFLWDRSVFIRRRTTIKRKTRAQGLNRVVFSFEICMKLPRPQARTIEILWMYQKPRPEKLTFCVSGKLRSRKM